MSISTTTTTASLTAPAVGSTVVVHLTNASLAIVGAILTVNDATTNFVGILQSLSGLNATVLCQSYIAGTPSSTVASGAVVSVIGQNPGPNPPASSDYVDLVSNQTVAGIKTFSSAPVMSGASISSGTVPDAALVTAPVTSVTGTAPVASSGGATPAISLTIRAAAVYVAAGTNAGATAHIVSDVATASGSTVSVTLTGAAAFASANYMVLIQDEAALGTLIPTSTQLAGSFTFASTTGHTYQFVAIGV